MLAPPQQAMETDHGIKTSPQSTTPNSSLDPNTEGLISIASTSSTSSSESFDLLLELNPTKGEHQKAQQQESSKSPKPDPIEPNNNLGYDPNRIPSSIFASKPASPMDWSVASNESLFSIHMGNNNSFSRDHAILMGGRSGELCNFDDLIYNVPGPLPKSNEINNSPNKLSQHSGVESCRKNVSVEKEDFNVRKEADLTPKASMRINLEDHNNGTDLYHNSSNISDSRDTPTRIRNHHFSDESGTTGSGSFAFPLLTGDVSYHKAKVANENIQPRPMEKPQREPEPKPVRDIDRDRDRDREREPDPKPHSPVPKPSGTKWFSWLSWFRFRPFSLCFPRPRSICC